MKKLLKKKGFTLIEAIIYIAIIGLISFSLISFSLLIKTARIKAMVAEEVQANANFSLDFIAKEIREASGIELPLTQESGSVLTLTRSSQPNLSFKIQEGILGMVENSLFIPITTNEIEVSNLVFTHFSETGEKPNLGIQITIRYRNRDSKEYEYERNFKTSISLRI